MGVGRRGGGRERKADVKERRYGRMDGWSKRGRQEGRKKTRNNGAAKGSEKERGRKGEKERRRLRLR
eukprot:6207437-Pleurochrysis_carterae.AAC.2